VPFRGASCRRSRARSGRGRRREPRAERLQHAGSAWACWRRESSPRMTCVMRRASRRAARRSCRSGARRRRRMTRSSSSHSGLSTGPRTASSSRSRQRPACGSGSRPRPRRPCPPRAGGVPRPGSARYGRAGRVTGPSQSRHAARRGLLDLLGRLGDSRPCRCSRSAGELAAEGDGRKSQLKKRGANATDVEEAGRRRSEADFHGHGYRVRAAPAPIPEREAAW